MIGGQQVLDGGVEALAGADRLFQGRRHVIERLGHDRVQDGVRAGDRLRRADGAELELVAGESERRGAVAVAGVLRQLGQHADADVEHAARFGALGVAFFELIDDVLELRAEENRNDRRRRFVGAEPVIVGGVRDADAQQFGILGHGPDDRRP